MERTESLVIQVAPDYENVKIKEMETFGWSLQNRQEIHEEGEAYGRPSLVGNNYIVTTKVKHYVKLHFVRQLSIPNLDKIKQIEAEYNSLLLPQGPSLKWPVILTAFFGFGIFVNNPQDPITSRIIMAALTALCGWWLSKRIKKRKECDAICQQNATRSQQLLEQARSLM